MRIHLGANSEGYRVAETLRTALSAAGHEVIWHAAPELDEGDDYTTISIQSIRAVVADEDAGRDSRAILVGGVGAGEVIAANKVNGARVVAATDAAQAAGARRHADVNGVVIPAAYVAGAAIDEIVAAFMATEFSGGYDDARRLVNVAEFETAGTIEGWMIET
ncbi:MAG: hypothetical protein ABS61_00280 [Microbacterium sp. SCN 70-18]|jgi:ribose 5-phosphate isomerase B|nr:MAG: hypothetical protein ABS61_00280 [Microbacterium sp. SCN 70-18]